MNKPNDTRLTSDSCSYAEKLKRTTGPGLYYLNVPYNDCSECKNLPNDPALRFQAYGPNTCTMQSAVDDSSELLGLNYKTSKCSADIYTPGKYSQKSNCLIQGQQDPRSCMAPTEDTRLSNPPNTLRGTGINRWEWLSCDPQERAIEEFDRIPVNYRMVAKDNHVPLIEVPEDQSAFFPQNRRENFVDWQKGNANSAYAPGYPQGNISYNVKCK